METDPFEPATALAERLRRGEISSCALTEAHLARIERLDPRLHAIVVLRREPALAAARARDADLDAGPPRGPLHGVPVTVKEAFDVSGERTTVNFPRLRRNVAARDSIVVQRLVDDGAVLLGKTNVPTLLSDYQSSGPLFPTANNPFDLARTPGGSTGGGAAAVAAGLSALEIGSDIGGSVRLPAHFCGLCALKPTENAYPENGHVPLPPGAQGGLVTLASVGPLARSVADLAVAWSVIGAPDWRYDAQLPVASPRPKHPSLAGYRLAWCDDMGRYPCGDETKRMMADVAARLARAGATVERVPFDAAWHQAAIEVAGTLFAFVMGQDLPWPVRQIMRIQFAGLERGSRLGYAAAIRRGLGLDFVVFARALARRRELYADLHDRFAQHDFLLCPVAHGPAFPHCRAGAPIPAEGGRVPYLEYVAPFTLPFNTGGNPVLVLPGGQSANGLPLGFQIAAPRHADEALLHFGALVEREGFTFRPPPGL